MQKFTSILQKPIYFVLGNHDFYYGSIATVHQKIKQETQKNPYLFWLPQSQIVEITPNTCLIGHGGWGDGRYGDFYGSRVALNDFILIEDLNHFKNKTELLEALNQLGDEAAKHFSYLLPEALQRYHKIIVLTHVPPFEESCWHEGKISDSEWLPYFSCKAVGDVLHKTMQQHSNREMLVLCGHTHGSGEVNILPNLHVITGGAEYYYPKIQQIFICE